MISSGCAKGNAATGSCAVAGGLLGASTPFAPGGILSGRKLHANTAERTQEEGDGACVDVATIPAKSIENCMCIDRFCCG